MTGIMRHLLILLSLLFTAGVQAVKVHPRLATVRQSDGTSLCVRSFGNHDFSYSMTTDGVLLYQEGRNYYIAAIGSDGMPRSTGVLAHEKDMRSEAETRLAGMQDKALFFGMMAENAGKARARREPLQANSTLLPHTGSPRVPVILVEFSDSTFKVPDPAKTFGKYLNAEELFNTTDDPEMGRNYGSVRRYFKDMSFGKFAPEFDVYGPVTLDKPLKHYGGGNSAYENMNDLFKDACTAIDADVDFAQYDSNGDGNIDLVYIIYAGYSQSWGGNSTDCIHPKSGVLTNNIQVDGKTVYRYGVNNELNATPEDQARLGLLINGIGLFCHEFSHCMGLPDMYPTPGSEAERCTNQNLDYWDLMDAGEYTQDGYRPTEYTAWERERFGWMAIDTLSEACDVTLKTLDEGGKAYRILNDKDATGKEYYLVENVQRKGWNRYLLGHGMLVYHVDYDDYNFSLGGCRVNSTAGHPRMSLIAADGLFMPEYFVYTVVSAGSMPEKEQTINKTLTDRYEGTYITTDIYRTEMQGDPFPGTGNATALTDTTIPATATVYTGGLMGKPITDIAEDTETGTVSFKFMGGGTNTITTAEADSGKVRIYSPGGQYLGSDMSRLGKGIYIINKKKVII